MFYCMDFLYRLAVYSVDVEFQKIVYFLISIHSGATIQKEAVSIEYKKEKKSGM